MYHEENDRYSDYESRFNPLALDRQARRKRKPKANHRAKKTEQEVIAEIAQTRDLEGGFKISYQPARFEEIWLLDALRPFYETTFITDVVAKVKGGKEANVYRCAAHDSTATEWLAVKVYRPRMFRNLRKDHVYREGRNMIDVDGKDLRERDMRAHRAVNKRSDFGLQVLHTSWLRYEYGVLEKLYTLGVRVPQPYAVSDNAVLMTYCGDEHRAAPALSECTLKPSEAKRLFEGVIHDVETMLTNYIIHGDLSAYNLLYWQGEVMMIDFPQVIDTLHNTSARAIFMRDVVRTGEYFVRQGVRVNPQQLAQELWQKHIGDILPIDYDLHDEQDD